MNDDLSQETPAASETTSSEPTQPNTAAQTAIAGARARRGPGRPPKNPKPATVVTATPVPATADLFPDAPAAAPAERSKKKKPSGKKKTRAELQQLVKQYERGEIPGREKAPAVAAPAPAAAAPLVAGDPAAKEKFARGVARFCGAVSRLVARRRGAHWQFDSVECDALGEATADCLEATEELAPSLTPWIAGAAKFAPFLMLGGVCYEIVDSRLEVDAEIDAGKRPRVMPGESNGAQLRKVD